MNDEDDEDTAIHIARFSQTLVCRDNTVQTKEKLVSVSNVGKMKDYVRKLRLRGTCKYVRKGFVELVVAGFKLH